MYQQPMIEGSLGVSMLAFSFLYFADVDGVSVKFRQLLRKI
jgi:hypothetical protein